MDALSEILRSARLSAGMFLRGEFTEPWCLSTELSVADCFDHLGPIDHLIIYHYIVEGRMIVEVPGEPAVVMLPGQAIVFTHNDHHTMAGRDPAVAVSALDVVQIPGPGNMMVIEHGGGGAKTRTVCGFLGGLALADDPLFSSLPRYLIYDCATARSGEVVRASLEFAAAEAADNRPGAAAVLAGLSELLLIEAIRSYVESHGDASGGWYDVLRDRSLSRAIAVIHKDPEQQWTVEKLGRTVGSSRSALAEKFNRHLGCAPAEYVMQHRMRLAARKLVRSHATIMDVAVSVGYGSEAAFSRAFKRRFGVSPSVWRKTQGMQQPS